MKNAALILNAVLLVAVAVLFYLFFSSRKETVHVKNEAVQQHAAPSGAFRIGYFELDSLQNHFAQFETVKNELNKMNDAIEKEKVRLSEQYENKKNSYQHQMSQQESEAAARDLGNLENDIRSKIDGMQQKLQDASLRRQKELRTMLEDFLKEYSTTNGYSFIFANEPTLIFYRDTAYNVTNDLIKGLNERYPMKK